MIDLRTYTYIDILQPKVASFLATVSQGFLPVEGQASLYIEIGPGIAINQLTDAVLKQTRVKPGMQIVEREFGVLEVHDFDQAEVRAAGEIILKELGMTEADRLRPQIVGNPEPITGMTSHHSMLINRVRHGDMILASETMLNFEVYPAGYALLAANEAEKAADIKILEFRAVGAFGRLQIGGTEENIRQAAIAMEKVLSSLSGRTESSGSDR